MYVYALDSLAFSPFGDAGIRNPWDPAARTGELSSPKGGKPKEYEGSGATLRAPGRA